MGWLQRDLCLGFERGAYSVEVLDDYAILYFLFFARQPALLQSTENQRGQDHYSRIDQIQQDVISKWMALARLLITLLSTKGKSLLCR